MNPATRKHEDIAIAPVLYMVRARAQRGLGLFGALIVLAIVAVAGYYVYEGVFKGNGEVQSCKEANLECLKKCRRTATEPAAATACQNECQRGLDVCK